MLCERCKMREANIKYTEVINGIKTEHNLCAQCAKEMDFGPYSAMFDGEFPLEKLLSDLLGISRESREESQTSGIVCPTCKTSYDTFVEKSCFGCQDCYSVFDPLIRDNIKKLQGSSQHVGKIPKFQKAGLAKQEREDSKVGGQLSREKQIIFWQAKLKEALQVEDYEEAAACRDEIRRLQESENRQEAKEIQGKETKQNEVEENKIEENKVQENEVQENEGKDKEIRQEDGADA